MYTDMISLGFQYTTTLCAYPLGYVGNCCCRTLRSSLSTVCQSLLVFARSDDSSTDMICRQQFLKPLAPFFFASAITVWGVAKMQDMGVSSE